MCYKFSQWKVLAIETLNQEFNIPEVTGVSNKLQSNNVPESDLISAGLNEYCTNTLAAYICKLATTEKVWISFPDIWAEGLRITAYRSDTRLDPNNYRGITVLSIFTKMAEMVFYDRLLFVGKAYGLMGECNWSMAADYVFILNSLNSQVKHQH